MALSDITSSTTKYKVVNGDTFSEIAGRCISVNMPGYSGLSLYNDGINKLKTFNPDIENINLIYVGQEIVLQGTANTKTKNNTQRAKITGFGLQSGTSRTVFATWSWPKGNTDHYEVQWRYYTGDNKDGFKGSYTDETNRESIYNAPENATYVTFRVRPISKTYKKNNKDARHWEASWTTREKYSFADNPPGDPGVPTVTISNKNKLTAKLENIDLDAVNADGIQYQILQNDTTLFHTGNATLTSTISTYSCQVKAGHDYKVRCRSFRDNLFSDWSDYSSGECSAPAAPEGIYQLGVYQQTATNTFDVQIHWYGVANADSYEVQYTTVEQYFDSNPNEVTSTTIGSQDESVSVGYTILPGLSGGSTYYFRVRSIRKGKKGAWCETEALTLGEKPVAPTTWSSTTSAIAGKPVNLYWVHNSADGSSQTQAELKLTINGVTTTQVIQNSMDFYEKDKTSCYTLDITTINGTVDNYDDLSGLIPNDNDIYKTLLDEKYYIWKDNKWTEYTDTVYEEGATIIWQVRTAGVLTDGLGNYEYSDWSTSRTVDIYAEPYLVYDITNIDNSTFDELNSFPIHISATAYPSTQKPIGYHVSVISNDDYETENDVGNKQIVINGSAIYSQFFDVKKSNGVVVAFDDLPESPNTGDIYHVSNDDKYYIWENNEWTEYSGAVDDKLMVTLSAGDLHLENDMNYTIKCVASMNSGLTAEITHPFVVAWYDVLECWPNAEIAIDYTNYTAAIRPYCSSEEGELLGGIMFSVYRREFDGSFTELATDLDNLDCTYITDPHPSLDYARYRIVATSTVTGAITYYDTPGTPVEEPSVILQWDEDWVEFNATDVAELDQPFWSGSLLKLMYNIDISDNHDKDVELVEYTGREHPVSYYGTQLKHTATWNMEIPKDDRDTLYALRRLARWRGNVYVREPSGSGYWASISVSFSQTHRELTIPITLNITRVEGGI